MRTLSIVFFLFLFSPRLSANWNGITSPQPAAASVRVISQTESELLLFVRVEGFDLREVTIKGSVHQLVSSPGCTPLLEAGAPDLPKLVAPVLAPFSGDLKVEVLSSSYRDFSIEVAPSKGNLYRNQDPGSVPYTFGSAYAHDGFYPGHLAGMASAYTLRDFSGQSLRVFPFQYDHRNGLLRVYHTMTLRVTSLSGTSWPTSNSIHSLDAEFAGIYARHFVNYPSLNYTPLLDQGNMLVIADSVWMPEMAPYVSWKNRKGQQTEIVSVQSIGTSPNAIRNFVSQYYQSNGLTFLLLVGDEAQVPTFPSASGDSDPSYGFLVGNDSYAEVIVGRFSANTAAELSTQVFRTLEYEQRPDTSYGWLEGGICVASDQGPGDDNEMDYEHARNMRQDLLGYHYAAVDELYDGSQGMMDSPGSPTASDLQQAINSGRGIITYTGHGSTSGLGTTGFNIQDVAGLANVGHLPFIWSVACVNGNFTNSTCLAEALLRARDSSDRPVGALSALMSTINQSWDPPMDAQDEMIDILVEAYPSNLRRTFGGISVNGCMHMNDQYGSAGDEITDTWTCFGDPSVTLRTTAPHPLLVQHPSTIDEAETSFHPSVSDDGALVCLSHHGVVVSRGWSLLGTAMLPVNGLIVGDTLDVTATAYNSIPYFGTVIVTAAATGLSELSAEDLNVFPNPATNQVFLSIATVGIPRCTMYDIAGRALLSCRPQQIEPGRFRLELKEVPSGIYYLEVETASRRNVRKVVVR